MPGIDTANAAWKPGEMDDVTGSRLEAARLPEAINDVALECTMPREGPAAAQTTPQSQDYGTFHLNITPNCSRHTASRAVRMHLATVTSARFVHMAFASSSRWFQSHGRSFLHECRSGIFALEEARDAVNAMHSIRTQHLQSP